jgi:hypothetical protein
MISRSRSDNYHEVGLFLGHESKFLLSVEGFNHASGSEAPTAANGQIDFSNHPVQGLDAKPSPAVTHLK